MRESVAHDGLHGSLIILWHETIDASASVSRVRVEYPPRKTDVINWLIRQINFPREVKSRRVGGY